VPRPTELIYLVFQQSHGYATADLDGKQVQRILEELVHFLLVQRDMKLVVDLLHQPAAFLDLATGLRDLLASPTYLGVP
jgi:hypothetical protein